MLYKADKKLIIAKGKIRKKELNIKEGKIIISPKRLILGGPAMFITENINHQKESIGLKQSIPLARIKLRLCDFS